MSEWIPIRIQLHKQPEVLRLAKRTGRYAAEVVGLLVAFWGWMSEVSDSGHVEGLGAEDLVEVAGGDVGFWEAAQAVGWLEIDQNGITMPHFEKWLSRGAKRRLMETQRKREEREEPAEDRDFVRKMSASDADKMRTESGLHHKTGQDIIPPPTPALAAGGVCAETGGEDGVVAKTFGADRDPQESPEDVEAAWKVLEELLPTISKGWRHQVKNPGGYVLKLRKAHRTPSDAGFPVAKEELRRRREGRDRLGLIQRIETELLGRTWKGHQGEFLLTQEGPCLPGREATPWDKIGVDVLRRIVEEVSEQLVEAGK